MKQQPNQNSSGEDKTLYWVKFIDQSNGETVDNYMLAYSLKHLEEEVVDILELKVIDNIIDLTEKATP